MQRQLRFGVFELNLDTGELRKAGTNIRLAPQPFQLLALLASRAGQTVTREDIKAQLWRDESDLDFERRINQCIKQIRAALADNASQPVYIETLRLYGYRFIAPVVAKTVAAPAPKVTVSDSSALERDIAARVIARITESPSQIGRIADVVKAKAAESPTPQPAPGPVSQQKLWLWLGVGGVVIVLAVAFFLWFR